MEPVLGIDAAEATESALDHATDWLASSGRVRIRGEARIDVADRLRRRLDAGAVLVVEFGRLWLMLKVA